MEIYIKKDLKLVSDTSLLKTWTPEFGLFLLASFYFFIDCLSWLCLVCGGGELVTQNLKVMYRHSFWYGADSL